VGALNAALVYNATDPCQVCDQPNFLTVFTLDKRFPGYTGPSGVKMMGSLARAEKCMNCGTWARAIICRAGPTRIKHPIRPAVVASLRMRARIH
jgi:hypothetical protein